jgi:hypothetical protein
LAIAIDGIEDMKVENGSDLEDEDGDTVELLLTRMKHTHMK